MKILNRIRSIFQRPEPKAFNEVENWKRLLDSARSGMLRDLCLKELQKAKLKSLLILSLLVPLTSFGANPHIVFNLSDFSQGAASYAIFKITPTNSPFTLGGTNPIVSASPRTAQFNSAGTVTVSNMSPLIYKIQYPADAPTTTFYISVPNTNATLYAADLTSVATNSPSNVSSAYSIASADAVFEKFHTNSILYVDTIRGNDSTGIRGRFDKPFATVLAAVTNAQAGDLVNGLPGEHNCGTNNVFRRALNYDFPATTLVFTNTYGVNNEAFQGLFDDRLTGASTNWIRFGKIIYYANPGALLRGAIVMTNALSEMHIQGIRIEGSCETGQLQPQIGGQNAFVHIRNGKMFMDVEEIEDTGRFTFGLDEFLSLALTNGPAISGIYWEQGDSHIRVGKLSVYNGYGLWGHEPTNTSTGDFHYSGDLVQVISNGTAGIYVDSSASVSSPNYKSWWRVNEMKAPNSIGLSLIGLNKFYWELSGKISGNPAISSGSIVWLNAQKVTGLPQALFLYGGENHLTVQQYEQGSGQASPFMALTGGNNDLIGGYAKVTNGASALLKVSGGTNLVQGMTLETTGAGNLVPPIFAATNSNLTLQDTVLISGGTNAVAATNIQGVAVRGTLTTDKTNGALVQIAGGTLVVRDRTVFARPYQFMADLGIQRTAFAVHNGTSATFSFIGDAGNFVISGQCVGTNAEAATGAGLVISTSPTATGLNGMSGNLNYRTGRNCFKECGVTVTNISSVITWMATLTDGSITNQMTNAPVGFNYAGFRFSTVASDTTYKFCTANAGTQTVTDTLVTADTSRHWFLTLEDTLFARWYGFIDGVCVATNVANIPAANTNLRYVDGMFSTVAATTNGFKLEWVAMGSAK